MNDRIELSLLNGKLSEQHGYDSMSADTCQLGLHDLYLLSQFQTITVRTFGSWKSSTVYKAAFNNFAVSVRHTPSGPSTLQILSLMTESLLTACGDNVCLHAWSFTYREYVPNEDAFGSRSLGSSIISLSRPDLQERVDLSPICFMDVGCIDQSDCMLRS